MANASDNPAPFRADIVAGISVAGLMLPEAVAYAAIAGLPADRAIMAGIAGCLAYALIGRSSFAIVSPTSSSAAILAATLAAMPGDIATKMGFATIVVLLTGSMFLIAALFKLGGLTGLVSRPVLKGFAFGLAITIIAHQLPVVTGTAVSAGNMASLLSGLARNFDIWNWYSIGSAVAALLLLILFRRWPFLPGAFFVLCAGILATGSLGLATKGIATVGDLHVALNWPNLPAATFPQYAELARYTLPLVLILFAESWGTISSISLRHGERTAPNRELAALGLSNLASAAVQGMPVGAGFSAGSASEAAGAKSRATGVIAAIGLAILIYFAAPLVAQLPKAVLSAVVIAALAHALNPAPFIRLWKLKRDFLIAAAAVLAVIIFGVLNGMLIAIALSLAALLKRLSSPRIAELGRLPSSRDFIDRAIHPDAEKLQDISIWRPSETLFFGNAAKVFEEILDRVNDRPASRVVIVSIEETPDLDSTTLDLLAEFDAAMKQRNIRLQLARVHDHVRAFMQAGGLDDLLSRSSYSVDDAVSAVLVPSVPLETDK